MIHARFRLGVALAFVLAVAGSAVTPISAASLTSTEPAAHPTLAQLIGQKLVVTMDGLQPDATILGMVRRGEVGGIVLLGSNVSSESQLRQLTSSLQSAAAAGGQPPLLIGIDQEGGSVKRISWAPPTITVPEMGQDGRTSVARSQGGQTGDALLGLGINVDLAPVADVPRSTRSFMYQQGRVFGFDATLTAKLADAFAGGLAAHGVLATMKHFPGIGYAKKNSDLYVDTISASRASLQNDLLPYRKAIYHDIALIMLSNVTYTAYDPDNAAGWSSAINTTLLRGELGFEGVTITDSLSGTAHARNVTVLSLGRRAAVAGTDMILISSSEATAQRLYTYLFNTAKNGAIPKATLRASYQRILAMKAGF